VLEISELKGHSKDRKPGQNSTDDSGHHWFAIEETGNLVGLGAWELVEFALGAILA
jgi:hypothetical protein